MADSYRLNPRLMIAGRDERRLTFSPTDQARAEGLVARYGGVLETSWVGTDRLVMQWTDRSGEAVRVEGSDPSALLGLLSQSVEMGATSFTH